MPSQVLLVVPCRPCSLVRCTLLRLLLLPSVNEDNVPEGEWLCWSCAKQRGQRFCFPTQPVSSCCPTVATAGVALFYSSPSRGWNRAWPGHDSAWHSVVLLSCWGLWYALSRH